MRGILNFFITISDYVFYRVWFLDRKRGNDSCTGASITLSFLETLVLINIISPILITTFQRDFLMLHKNIIVNIIMFLTVLLIFLNNIRYKDKYDKLHRHWKDEPKLKRRFHGLLIILAHVILIGIMIGLSFIP